MKTYKGIVVLFAYIAYFLSGCAQEVLVAKPTNLSFLPSNQYEITVALLKSQELMKSKWKDENPIGSEINHYELGNALFENSNRLLTKMFNGVEIVNQPSANKRTVDLIFIPKMVSVEQNRPLWIWQDTTINLAFEWTVKSKTLKTIWVDTVIGEATTKLSDPAEERVDLLMKDIYTKSYEAIIASPEIRKYVMNIKH